MAWENYIQPSQRNSWQDGCSPKGDGKGKGKRRTSLPEKDRRGLDLPQRVATHYTQNIFFIEDSTCNGSFLRAKHGIEIVDWETEQEYLEDMPTPVPKLEYAPFGDAVKEQLKRRGYREPTPIQMQGWPLLMQGWDLVGIAPTGSGKTLCYLLPLLEHVEVQPALRTHDGCIALVLLPLRELCQQIAQEAEAWCKYGGFSRRVVSCSTGDRGPELGRCDILCASSGKLGDLLSSEQFDIDRTTYVVVDEADDMLLRPDHENASDMISPLQILMKSTRKDKQTLLFTATWRDGLKDIKLDRGLRIAVGGTDLKACERVTQRFWCPGRADPADPWQWRQGETKDQALVKAIRSICCSRDGTPVPDEIKAGAKVIVFVNADRDPKGKVGRVVQLLEEAGVLEPGDIEGFGRTRSLWYSDVIYNKFRDGSCPQPRVLVTTDVLSRGFDFFNCAWVVNYDYPSGGRNALLKYVHRIGRTGRGDRTGTALTLLEELELRFSRELLPIATANGHRVSDYIWLERECRNVKRYQDAYNQQNREQAQARTPREAETPRASFFQPLPNPWDVDLPWPDWGNKERYEHPPL
ncbi:RH20 [Symbiodinium sp. CCMP2456]|nr:RH20 [Symbiodinium sp. CCMP2456]